MVLITISHLYRQCDNTQKFLECFNNFSLFANICLEIEHVQFMSYTCSLLLPLWVEIHQFGVVKTLRRFALLCNIFISNDVNNDNLTSLTNKPFSTRKISYKLIFVLHKSLLHGFDYHFNCNQHVILVFICHGWVNIDNSNISILW